MKAIILEAPFELKQGITKKPQLTEGHALVQIKRIGICGTDYHAYQGHQPFFSYPRILGHELSGIVVDINAGAENATIKLGDKVAIEPYINCQKCHACKKGFTNCCENIAVLGVHEDGGMTEYLKVPIRKLHSSKSLNFDELALVETLGIGYHAVKRSSVTDQDQVLVIGAGPIGIAVAQFAKHIGAKVIMADFNSNRLDFVQKNGWLDIALKIESELTPEFFKNQTNSELPDVIIDATGNRQSMQNTFNLISHGGRITYVGIIQGDICFFDPLFHKKEISLFASRNCLSEDFRKIIHLKETGQIDSKPWVTHRSTFESIERDFKEFLKPESKIIKALVEM